MNVMTTSHEVFGIVERERLPIMGVVYLKMTQTIEIEMERDDITKTH